MTEFIYLVAIAISIYGAKILAGAAVLAGLAVAVGLGSALCRK